MVSVLFLSSTGQPCACSVCSKDVEAEAEHLSKVSSHLSFYLVSLPVSQFPSLLPDFVIALRFKNQISYLNKIKASYLILLIFQF